VVAGHGELGNQRLEEGARYHSPAWLAWVAWVALFGSTRRRPEVGEEQSVTRCRSIGYAESAMSGREEEEGARQGLLAKACTPVRWWWWSCVCVCMCVLRLGCVTAGVVQFRISQPVNGHLPLSIFNRDNSAG
jgi:hypothetical protein